jgi:hypothetical protein
MMKRRDGGDMDRPPHSLYMDVKLTKEEGLDISTMDFRAGLF